MHHLADKAAEAVCDAIDHHQATLVPSATFKAPGCEIKFFWLNGHYFRCEKDDFDGERYIDELDISDIEDFHHCHACPK